VGFLPIPDTI